MIGDYNDQDQPTPVRTLWQLVVKRLTMRGFVTCDHWNCLAQAQADLINWVTSGVLTPLETLYDGLEAAPSAFIDLMARRTTGKTVARL